MKLLHIPLVLVALATAACHAGVIVTDPKAPVGGTIAGVVTTDGKAAVMGRKVSAVDTTSGSRFDATTGVNGGYTIKVPEGTYRLEVELLAGEKVAKQPAQTHINRSDLDAQRDFVITAGRTAG